MAVAQPTCDGEKGGSHAQDVRGPVSGGIREVATFAPAQAEFVEGPPPVVRVCERKILQEVGVIGCPLGQLYGLPTHCIGDSVPCLPAAGHGEEPELAVA